MTYTEREGWDALAALNTDQIPDEVRLTRLFGIAMVFYRQPVGDAALEAIAEVIGRPGLSALMFITGFITGSVSTSEGPDFAKLAGLTK